MLILVVGLGSMGKRRVRNLQALGIEQIIGFDLRQDRCDEAAKQYGITVFQGYEEAISTKLPDAMVISTDPKHHMYYAWDAYQRGIPCFIEASVTESEKILQLYESCKENGPIMAPSCTMRYFPGPKKVKELINKGVIGHPLNLNYQSGQYLPDWHPWEEIGDFYVSDRETGGCREIVPFELTWLNDLFGHPEPLACVKSKQTDMKADIDDIYHCLLRYPDAVLANITVEVISRPQATRELRVIGTKGEIVLSGDEQVVRYTTVDDKAWRRIDLSEGTVESGYINPEEPYIEEMKDFVAAVQYSDSNYFPNTLLDDFQVLSVLYQLEALANGEESQ